MLIVTYSGFANIINNKKREIRHDKSIKAMRDISIPSMIMYRNKMFMAEVMRMIGLMTDCSNEG